jgi:hypothetical protein
LRPSQDRPGLDSVGRLNQKWEECKDQAAHRWESLSKMHSHKQTSL